MPSLRIVRTACVIITLLITGTERGLAAEGPAFLKQYCVACHGPSEPEADLSLHRPSDTVRGATEIATWKATLEQVEVRQMPPADARQPSPAERADFVRWVQATLAAAGSPVEESRWQPAGKGNLVDHDLLFAQAASNKAPGAKTPARLWRLTGQAYEQFLDRLNRQYALGIRNYGEHRMRAPWNFTPQHNFSDYASAHKIGEAEIEYHLRNATKVARALVVRLAGRRPSPGFSDWIPEMNVVLKTEEPVTDEQARAAVTATFQSILRREPTRKELQNFSDFLLGRLRKLPAEKAVEHVLIALLFRPEVTYRVEIAPGGAGRRMLAPRPLARALSFALTDDRPDDALRQAATAGQLTTREDVRREVERMLSDDELYKPRILRFFQEYFGHHAAIGVFKDEVTLKEAGIHRNAWYPKYFVSDADRLIEWVLVSDRDVLFQLLTTSRTFLLTMDPRTRDSHGESTKNYRKSHPDKPHQLFEQLVLDVYEVPLKSRREWSGDRPYDMPAEHRAGLLTHPAWLIAHSGNFDNHAIRRGRWIREKLLGGLVPDVPVTVNAMLPDEPHSSLRERMRVTREAACWKCHRQMDPLGLPFEQFDHFGRFRTAEKVVDREATDAKRNRNKQGFPRRTYHTTVPLDTSGAVNRSGDSELDGNVSDPFQLIRRLAASKRVEQVFVRHAFRYFLGRNETLDDGPVLVAAHRAYADNDGSMNALITSLLTSDAFLYRHAGPPAKP